ncbi:hypothetical protein BGX34_008229 [Mortierella sp. NVP85]|nr:hypothetical protein BGX34_008229 [Mortierella sp. NVP85]
MSFSTDATTTRAQTISTREAIPLKRSQTVFRHDCIPEGMNLNIRTASERTLMFYLPSNDIDPYEVVRLVIRSFGPIDSFEHCFMPHGSRLEIHISDRRVYNQVKRQGIMVDDQLVGAIVPTPTRFNIKKIKFCRAPLHYKGDDLKKALTPFGTVLQVDRFYWMIEGSKVFSTDGFVLFDVTSSPYGELPKTIDFGSDALL